MEFENKKYTGAPWCLGRYDSFEIGKPQLITLLEHDYVIWKDKSGNLNAIDNICPHAGANLAQGGYIINFKGKDCLACPYHGNKVQFLGDGTVIIDGNISSKAIQPVLPLQIVDRLVWTYGLNWYEQDGKLTARSLEPKLPIPDYSNIPHLPKSHSQLRIDELDYMYSRSQSVNCNILQAIWNIHDVEHFVGTHRNTANNFRDRLVLEDISILENLYPTFDKKITLKNDTPAQLAMNYLENWRYSHCS